MKKEKMSFKKIKDVLSRDEMKAIMAGSNDGCGMCMSQYGTGSGSQWMQHYCSFVSGWACVCTDGASC